MKVRAKGPPDTWVGYYNHIRRRGGDVFTLSPVEIKQNGKSTTLVPEKQFSSRWMDRVPEELPETKPAHFNQVGRGQSRSPAASEPVGEGGSAEKDVL